MGIASSMFPPLCYQCPYPRRGLRNGLSVWSLYVLPVSPRVVSYPHKKYVVILVTKLPPPGQSGCLLEGKGTGWDNMFLPRATSNQGNSPLSGVKERLDTHTHEFKSVALPRLA